MAVHSSSRGTAGLALLATLVAGLGTYAYLAIGSRNLADEASDLFAVFWSLSLILGFGFFLPIEQMLASGHGLVPRRSGGLLATICTLMAAALVFSIAATGVATDGWTKSGSLPLSIAVGAMLVSAPLQFSVRGAALRLGRNRLYSIMLIVDASSRVMLALLFALVTPDDVPLPFMLAVPASALIAHGIGVSVMRSDRSTPSAASPVPIALTLLPSTLIAQLIINAAPIAVFALAEAGVASQFQYSFSLARIPLFMVVPLQSMLIAPFAQLIVSADRTEFVRRLRLGAMILLTLALVGGLLGALLGPPTIEFVFGSGRSLGGVEVGLLVAAVIVHVALIIGTQLLIAAKRPQDVAVSWIVALAAAAAVLVALAVPAGVTLASGSAVLIGSAAGAFVALQRSLNALRVKDAP